MADVFVSFSDFDSLFQMKNLYPIGSKAPNNCSKAQLQRQAASLWLSCSVKQLIQKNNSQIAALSRNKKERRPSTCAQ
jgi:hypothetical protein